MKKYIAMVILGSALSGCQSTTEAGMQAENLCTGSNWAEVGHKSAMSGLSVREFNKYQESCQNLPEEGRSAYLEGYTAGIKEYCTYENGFKVGESGVKNPNVCPLESRENYNVGFNNGHLTLKDKKDQLRFLADMERQGQQNDIAKSTITAAGGGG